MTHLSKNDSDTIRDEMILLSTDSLHRLPPEGLDEVWTFIQFAEYKMGLQDDSSEDEFAWQMVQLNEQYKKDHPNEPMVVYQSKEELREALAEL